MAVVARGFHTYARNFFKNATLSRHSFHSGVVNPCALNKGTVDEQEPDYKYELSFNEEEWKYVERLLPLKLVPEVTKKSEYPSGWRPQSEDAMKQPYYVRRSKNHMLPVYLKNIQRGYKKETYIRHIHGDLWRLHEELHKHLEEILQKPIVTCVMEGNGCIRFKGDVVYYCEQFLLEKGF